MKTAVLAVSLAVILTSCGAQNSNEGTENLQTDTITSPSETVSSQDVPSETPVMVKNPILEKPKADLESVINAPFEKCSTPEFLSQSKKLIGSPSSKNQDSGLPDDSLRTLRCQVRAAIRSPEWCSLIAQKDRAKCETLVAAIKTLSSPSSDKGTKGAAIAAYQEYFIDFEAFPPSKYAKTPSE